MLLLGIDLGTSSIKVSVVDAATRQTLVSVSYPDAEREITVRQPGWAEQDPRQWWADVQAAICRAHATGAYDPRAIGAVGIAYQMHGLVVVNARGEALRDAIIWCDSRAVPYGEQAFRAIGEACCLAQLLNSPGNFTAAKLAWVQEHEPALYRQIDKIMLPGDYLALKLTGEATTSAAALSEGIFWDFAANQVSADVLVYFGFAPGLLPPVRPVFGEHGRLRPNVAADLGLSPGIPVAYKAGDQPNNALVLGVLEPGEVAATAGTSGVIYAVTDQRVADPLSRVNTFAHVNHRAEAPRLGVLLCLNGAGSLNRWARDTVMPGATYAAANARAATAPVGAGGLLCLPFGNGAERVLENRLVGAHLLGLDLNRHTAAHVLRAAQEGVAFAFRYGLDVLRETGLCPTVVKASRTNLFLSPLFAQSFANATGLTVALSEGDGSFGAALGAGIGVGAFRAAEAGTGRPALQLIAPDDDQAALEVIYQQWSGELQARLAHAPASAAH